jgi:hypothetical protein
MTAAVAVGAAPGARGGAPGRGAATRPATRPAVTAEKRQAAIAQHQKAFDLYSAGKFAEAKVENDKTLLLDPNNEDAIRLHAVLQDRLAGNTTTAPGGGTVAAGGRPKTLTNQQISLIRLMEMSDNDRNLTGPIKREAREEYWNSVLVKEAGADTSQGAHNAFLMNNPQTFAEVARRFRDTHNPRYTEQVVINNDPANLAEFKTGVNVFVLQNCATAPCHGGNGAGDFRLLRASDNASIYTNFYIMSMYTTKNGGRVIDRDNPERSLFIQYALPKQQAATAHPGDVDVRKIASMQDPRFQQMVQWVQSLALPRPNYGITVDVGGAAPAPPAAPVAPVPPGPPARGR